ncbi:MAG: DUF2948 family protein [Pseudomonadota bacterium]
MSEDARFEEAPVTDRPLRLRAESAEDLQIISSLVQDAVARASDVAWMRRKRRLVLLINRFRWEDAEAAEREDRPFERVRSALSIEGVTGVRARGLAPGKEGEMKQVVALLSLAFEASGDAAGRVLVACADEVTFAADVEMLEVTLGDLTRPWEAQAAKAPTHED